LSIEIFGVQYKGYQEGRRRTPAYLIQQFLKEKRFQKFGKKQYQETLEIVKVSHFSAKTTLKSSSKIGQKSTLYFVFF